MIEVVSTQTEPDVVAREDTTSPIIEHVVCCDEDVSDDVALCGEDVSDAIYGLAEEASCLACVIAVGRGHCPFHVVCLYPIFGEGQVGGRQ